MKRFFQLLSLTLLLSLSGCTWFADADCTKLGQLSCSHTYEWRTKDPTCQSGGYTAQSCTKCGYTLESTKKDLTPIREHTPLNSCGFCGMDYFQAFTQAFTTRETVQHSPYENTWSETNVITSNDIDYRLSVCYVEQTTPVFSITVERNWNIFSHVVTLIINNASGTYDYVFDSGESHCEGHLFAQETTIELPSFDVVTTNMETAAQILSNDIIVLHLRAAINALKTLYLPPTLGFTIKHFGFEQI